MLKVALLVLLNLCLVSTVYGIENEPEGFGGIKWGANINTLEDMQLIQEKGAIKLYLRLNDNVSIGETELMRVEYFFYRDRLAAVRIPFNGSISFGDLKRVLRGNYGEAQYQNEVLKEFIWKGDLVVIVFKYVKTTRKGHIVYIYNPIAAEWDAAEKTTSKNAEND